MRIEVIRMMTRTIPTSQVYWDEGCSFIVLVHPAQNDAGMFAIFINSPKGEFKGWAEARPDGTYSVSGYADGTWGWVQDFFLPYFGEDWRDRNLPRLFQDSRVETSISEDLTEMSDFIALRARQAALRREDKIPHLLGEEHREQLRKLWGEMEAEKAKDAERWG